MAILFAILTGLDRLPAVGAWNDGASVWLQGPEEYGLTLAGFFTDWLFSAPVVLGLAALVCLALTLTGRRLGALSVALVFPLVAVEVALKYLIDQPPASKVLHVRALFPSSHVEVQAIEHGFPSGHAARMAFVIGWLVLLTVPERYRWRVGVPTLVVMLFIAWTRIYVGDHSLLEIIAGLLLAAVFLPLAGALSDAAKLPPAR